MEFRIARSLEAAAVTAIDRKKKDSRLRCTQRPYALFKNNPPQQIHQTPHLSLILKSLNCVTITWRALKKRCVQEAWAAKRELRCVRVRIAYENYISTIF